MSDQKLTELTELTTVAPDDNLYITDTSASASRKVQASNLGGVWAQTSAESSAGVTPTDYRYSPGDVRRYGAAVDGSTDDSAALQAAIDQNNNGGESVKLAAGDSAFATSLDLYNRTKIEGHGIVRSTLTYTGSAMAFKNNTPGTRIYDLIMRDFYLVDTGTGTIGLDLDSISTSSFENLAITNFDTQIKINSPTSGYAVYNRFFNVKVQAGVGVLITGTSSNANNFFGCRTNLCTTGFKIDDSNDNHIYACQIESGTKGVEMTASGAGLTPSNFVSECRFETNSGTDITIGTNCSDTRLVNNFHVGSNTVLSDSGTRTQVTGVHADRTAMSWVSALASASGTPFNFERTAAGGSVPMVKLVDSNTGSGTPPALQIECGRTTGHGIRILDGVGGSESFGIEARGRIRTNQDTANTNTQSGATAHQLPIYNESGTLLGYIPVYGSAW
jgi:hypothetical protein